eukprot:3731331-Heterocapsa_arctica.AAC.1
MADAPVAASDRINSLSLAMCRPFWRQRKGHERIYELDEQLEQNLRLLDEEEERCLDEQLQQSMQRLD